MFPVSSAPTVIEPEVEAVLCGIIDKVCKLNHEFSRPPEFYDRKIKMLAQKIETHGGDPKLVDGWTVTEVVRETGLSIGHSDLYYIQPMSNKRFRSTREVLRHFQLDNHPIQSKTTHNDVLNQCTHKNMTVEYLSEAFEIRLYFDMDNHVLSSESRFCLLQEIVELESLGTWNRFTVDLDSCDYESLLITNLNDTEVKQWLITKGYESTDTYPNVFEKYKLVNHH